MKHLSPADYGVVEIEIPDNMCYWEPQGNGHYYTTCGNLIYERNYKERGIIKCMKCGKIIYDGVR